MTYSSSPRSGRCIALAAALLALLWSRPSEATVMEEVPVEEMARRADAIVLATVERSGAVLLLDAPGGAFPYTMTRLRVAEWIKGRGRSTVSICERGGIVQRRSAWIAGTPRYAPGEQVLVFLEAHPDRPGEYRTFAMAQGKLVVTRGIGGARDTARRDLDGIAFARWASGEMVVEDAQNGLVVDLAILLEVVRDAVRGGAR